MYIPEFLRYNPKNHNWPEVRRCLPVVLIGTLLLAAVETPVLYEIKTALFENKEWNFFTSIPFGVLNVFLLRKYHRILPVEHTRYNTRFGAYCYVVLATMIYMMPFSEMEHCIRADKYHAQRLEGLTFNEAEYFYIDNPGRIDTARIGHDVERIYKHYRNSTSVRFRGYFVVPFCGHDSVFYAITYDGDENGKWKQFEQLTAEKRKKIMPDVHNHLFHRIKPCDDSYYWTAAGYSYILDSVCHDMESIHRSVLLVPIENDTMPQWTKNLKPLSLKIVCIFVITSFVFICSNTSGSTKHRKKKHRRVKGHGDRYQMTLKKWVMGTGTK